MKLVRPSTYQIRTISGVWRWKMLLFLPLMLSASSCSLPIFFDLSPVVQIDEERRQSLELQKQRTLEIERAKKALAREADVARQQKMKRQEATRHKKRGHLKLKRYVRRSIEPISVVDAPEVLHYVEKYTVHERRYIEDALPQVLSNKGKLGRIFKQYGLPEELIFIALLESRFNSQASSAAGAVGLWQLTAQTARAYGLQVSGKIDERRDIIRSTDAAARHFRDLYNAFGDWALAVAAYNSGKGRVDRAVRDAGTRDFFVLSGKGALGAETLEFVPKFMALTHVFRNLEEYGFLAKKGQG